MADFQSSKTAAEIEEVLTGALTYKSPQTLTESEKAFVRAKIGATEIGEGIKIVSHYDSLEELEAAVPKPRAGDAYSIGTEIPYNLYIFDFVHATWMNYGAIRANDIEARMAQNKAVTVGAWEEDTDVFTDYTYKAAIPLAEVTGNDFPIVAFSPSDAASGVFCPVAYAFDGYVEIWANAIPKTDIVVPAITFIVQDTEDGETGNNTKGITNATAAGASVTVSPEAPENPQVGDMWFDSDEDSLFAWASAVYPIGSIYMSVNPTNPAEIFGGTWERIKDMFLLAAGDSYAAGATGGEAKHTLTTAEMPSHAHPINYNNTSGGVPFPAYHAVITEYQVSAGVYNSANTAKVGDSQPHNNMPPYLAVYVWQRIA